MKIIALLRNHSSASEKRFLCVRLDFFAREKFAVILFFTYFAAFPSRENSLVRFLGVATSTES